MARRSKYDEIHDKYQTTSNRKQGVKYERLAALVFKSLEMRGIIIHDKKLRGKSGVPSQIDVIAEDKGNRKKRILVECKDFDIKKGKKVGINIVRSFSSVIDDLKPRPEGVIVTCNGFSAPAMKFAAYRKIKLGILRQINDADLEGLITKINLDFSYKNTPDASMRLLFPSEAIIGEFQQCIQENGIREISLADSGVYFEGSNGEICGVNQFVNAMVDEYRRENPTHEYGIIPVDLSGSHIKIKDVASFPINAAEITFIRNIYSIKLESYSERIAEMIFRILENGGKGVIIFGDDLERFKIDPVTHEVGGKPGVVEIPGWDSPVVKGTTLIWTKKIGNTFLQIGYSKDKATEEYATTGLILPSPPQEQWLIKNGMRYVWALEPKDYQRVFSGELVDTHSETGDVIAEDISTPQKMATYLERMAAILSQPLRDLILWILAERGGKMERNRLRYFTGRDYAFLNPILEELVREGKIKTSDEMVILM